MKIIIISDSHGNIANLKHLIGFARKINCDAIIHCGDWNNIESIKTVIEYKIPLYSVLGNADIDPKVDEMLSLKCKKFDQLFLKTDLGGKKIGIVHKLETSEFRKKSINILFYGHTHRQSDEIKDGLRVVNPGALEKGILFVVYDTEANKVEFIHD